MAARKKVSQKAKKADKKHETLEEKTLGVEAKPEAKKVIEEVVSEIKVSDSYKKIEKKLKKHSDEEKEATSVGVKPDNYYTAKGKEDEENELGRNVEETSGSFGSRRA